MNKEQFKEQFFRQVLDLTMDYWDKYTNEAVFWLGDYCFTVYADSPDKAWDKAIDKCISKLQSLIVKGLNQ